MRGYFSGTARPALNVIPYAPNDRLADCVDLLLNRVASSIRRKRQNQSGASQQHTTQADAKRINHGASIALNESI
jgi:hypothetical protein